MTGRPARMKGPGVFAFNPGMVLTELLTDVEVIEGSEERLKRFPTIVRMWAKLRERMRSVFGQRAAGTPDDVDVTIHRVAAQR